MSIFNLNDYFLVGLLLCTLLCIVTMVQSQTQESSTSPTEADGDIDNGISPAITTSPTERDGGIDNGTSPAIKVHTNKIEHYFQIYSS